MTDSRISGLPVASEAIAGNDLIAVTNVSQPGTGETQKFTQDQLTASQKILNFRTATELTIANGAITITQSWHTIDTQADAASDDLDVIYGGVGGDILLLRASHTDRTVVIKHGTGNILCPAGADIILDSTSSFVFLVCDATLTNWLAMFPGLSATNPKLGGDLYLQQFSIQLPAGEPTANLTAIGLIEYVTVDSNNGIGCPLFVDANGHYNRCDADDIATMPCTILTLQNGTGTRKVLRLGKLRNDAWNWTVGGLIYVDTTVGELTQTKPTGENDVIQPVGHALSDDCMWFQPSYII